MGRRASKAAAARFQGRPRPRTIIRRPRCSASLHIRPALDLPTADPYDTLGVPSGASAEDIKRAFRRKASFYHPDRNAAPDAAQRFREAQAAYELLSDDTRRRAHDEKRQKHLLDDPVAVARRMFESYLEDIE